MYRILVIEDDKEFCGMLAGYLRSEGFAVTSALNGAKGLEQALSNKHDLIVLEMNLLGMGSFEVLRAIRVQLRTPVLGLADHTEAVNHIVELASGADEYLQKPFLPREFLGRVRALQRRTKEHPTKRVARATPGRIAVGDIELDKRSRTVRCKGNLLELSSVEFDVLELLLKAAGRIVTKEQLAKQAFGRPIRSADHFINNHLSSLRRKLGREFAETERIVTIRGLGYVYMQAD